MTPYYDIGYFSGFVLTLGMAVLVMVAQPRTRQARLWALIALCVGLWFLGRWMVLRAPSETFARWSSRAMYIPTVFINPVFYHFTLALLRKRVTKLLLAGYAVSAVLGIINLFTDSFIISINEGTVFRFYEQAGSLYKFHFANYLICSGAGTLVLLQGRRTVDLVQRRQIDYILIACVFGFICGATTFPLIFGVKMPPFAAPFVQMYAIVITYAILKHQLLDIRIVVRKTVVYSTITLLLTAVYVTVLFIITHALEGWVGTPNVYSSVAAACAIAVLFHPLRTRLQHWVDRRFPREALDQVLLREATSGFVHEIKRPLANINMPAQLALTDIEDMRNGKLAMEEGLSKLASRLDFIVRESFEAGGRMEALRELLAAGTPVRETIDLTGVIKSAVEGETRRALRCGVTLTNNVDEQVDVIGNAKLLEIAFTNLLKNGIEAAAPPQTQGEVSVDIERRGADVVINIQDSGPGISKQNISLIFDPYFSTKGSAGMGIGLSLVREIVRLHGGKITVSSEIGHGTAMVIVLPVAGSDGARHQ